MSLPQWGYLAKDRVPSLYIITPNPPHKGRWGQGLSFPLQSLKLYARLPSSLVFLKVLPLKVKLQVPVRDPGYNMNLQRKLTELTLANCKCLQGSCIVCSCIFFQVSKLPPENRVKKSSWTLFNKPQLYLVMAIQWSVHTSISLLNSEHVEVKSLALSSWICTV